MGEVIRLEDRRARLRPDAVVGDPVRAEFLFDLASPFTYLAAERVDRAFDAVAWTPACSGTLRCRAVPANEREAERIIELAEERAAALRLPLVWPERFPTEVPAAMRVAARAQAAGRGAAFVLAATRLAFCGGFDLEDPEILAEAAAAAGVVLDECLHAARDEGFDGEIEGAGRLLLSVGADRLPALRVGRALYWGERRVGDALTAARTARVAAVH